MDNLREYVVTAVDRAVLDELCKDIESEGGSLYIPNRKVDIADLRPMSRSTHYYLSDDEAALIRKDPRVLAVELTPKELGITPRPQYTQTSEQWNKSSTVANTHVNWGLLRCTLGQQITNWGSDGTTSQSGTITLPTTGKHVDVVIVDGFFNPAHPEYAVNADGTGGSRVIQYNWFQHNPEVTGGAAGTYIYTPYVDAGNSQRTADNNHGAHVAGTAVGNTQGWARDANIYNLNPYSTDVNSINALYIFDYIRAFHNSKPINPVTGRKNPTIVNNSWGYGYTILASSISSVVYRGQLYSGPFTAQQLISYGVDVYGGIVAGPIRYPALDADLDDAADDGIIIISAASNDYFKVDVPGGLDYDNYFIRFGTPFFYHRGTSPGAADSTISVGSIGTTVAETKSTFSNCGPRTDIFSPGSQIISSVNSGSVSDSRNPSYFLSKYSGTSMASPQVCGILACALETYPNMTQEEAVAYITSYSKKNQMTDTAGGYDDYTSLQGAANRYLYFYQERPVSGFVYPKKNYKSRPATGKLYPRPRIKR